MATKTSLRCFVDVAATCVVDRFDDTLDTARYASIDGFSFNRNRFVPRTKGHAEQTRRRDREWRAEIVVVPAERGKRGRGVRILQHRAQTVRESISLFLPSLAHVV